MFSRTFGFLHFLFEHFLFTFSGAWKTTKAFFCLSFFVLRFIPFLLSHICKWCRGSFNLNGISQGLFILNAKFSQLIVSFFHVWFLLIYTRSSYITKSFFRQEFSPSQSLTTFRVRYEKFYQKNRQTCPYFKRRNSI